MQGAQLALAENKRRTLPGEATLRQQQVRKPRADDASIAADDVATPSSRLDLVPALAVLHSGAGERPDRPRVRFARRKPKLFRKRSEDLGNVCAPF